MKKFLLLFCATLMLALGFSSCGNDPTKTWKKAEIEEIAKAAATTVYFDLSNPSFYTVDEAVIAQNTYIDGMSVDSVFRSLKPSTLKRVADVCINKSRFTDKKGIVREYLKNISVYSNMSDSSPIASNNNNNAATGAGGSGVTKDDSTKVFETSFNYYTDTVNGKPVKVEIKTIKSYVKP